MGAESYHRRETAFKCTTAYKRDFQLCFCAEERGLLWSVRNYSLYLADCSGARSPAPCFNACAHQFSGKYGGDSSLFWGLSPDLFLFVCSPQGPRPHSWWSSDLSVTTVTHSKCILPFWRWNHLEALTILASAEDSP